MTQKKRDRKPLIYWSRWHGALLRFYGKNSTAVWGELEYADAPSEPFRYDLYTWVITVGDGATKKQIELDEKGIPV